MLLGRVLLFLPADLSVTVGIMRARNNNKRFASTIESVLRAGSVFKDSIRFRQFIVDMLITIPGRNAKLTKCRRKLPNVLLSMRWVLFTNIFRTRNFLTISIHVNLNAKQKEFIYFRDY